MVFALLLQMILPAEKEGVDAFFLTKGLGWTSPLAIYEKKK